MKIFAKNEMKLSRDAGEYLARICGNPHLGLLRTCTSVVGHAIFLYKHQSKVLTAAMLWEMHKELSQPSELSHVEALMRSDDLRMAKVG